MTDFIQIYEQLIGKQAITHSVPRPLSEPLITYCDNSRAVELLKSQGYPRDKFAKIGEVFQKSGLVSSPTEERIRYMYALSQEIAETLTRIDGVMNARVHIVIPDLGVDITATSPGDDDDSVRQERSLCHPSRP